MPHSCEEALEHAMHVASTMSDRDSQQEKHVSFIVNAADILQEELCLGTID